MMPETTLWALNVRSCALGAWHGDVGSWRDHTSSACFRPQSVMQRPDKFGMWPASARKGDECNSPAAFVEKAHLFIGCVLGLFRANADR